MTHAAISRSTCATATTIVVGAAASLSLVMSPLAGADPGQPGPVDMNLQCSIQYPGEDGFGAGQAYLVAPQDAYSWRCRRVGLSAELSVNPGAYCAPLTAVPVNDGTPNWRCE